MPDRPANVLRYSESRRRLFGDPRRSRGATNMSITLAILLRTLDDLDLATRFDLSFLQTGRRPDRGVGCPSGTWRLAGLVQ